MFLLEMYLVVMVTICSFDQVIISRDRLHMIRNTVSLYFLNYTTTMTMSLLTSGDGRHSRTAELPLSPVSSYGISSFEKSTALLSSSPVDMLPC